MSSKEYLQQVTVGQQKTHNSTIDLRPYDPCWPKMFEQEAQIIQNALGASAVQVEHVGSTSVPGLSAKPILDILLLVEDSSREETYLPYLEQAGYFLRIREPDWFQHRVLRKETPSVNLHLFSKDCEEAARMIRFRDWLRSHQEDRELYQRTKEQLATQTWEYVQDYADAKTQVVKEIQRRAEQGKA